MGTVDLPKKPSARHAATPNPRKPAVSLKHDDPQQAVARIVEEEAGNVVRYLAGKLPPGAGDSLDTRALKEKLSVSIDRRYRQISSRLAATVAPKQDEAAVGTRQSPAGIAQLLSSLGGADTFNSGEIEKSAVRKNTMS